MTNHVFRIVDKQRYINDVNCEKNVIKANLVLIASFLTTINNKDNSMLMHKSSEYVLIVKYIMHDFETNLSKIFTAL